MYISQVIVEGERELAAEALGVVKKSGSYLLVPAIFERIEEEERIIKSRQPVNNAEVMDQAHRGLFLWNCYTTLQSIDYTGADEEFIVYAANFLEEAALRRETNGAINGSKLSALINVKHPYTAGILIREIENFGYYETFRGLIKMEKAGRSELINLVERMAYQERYDELIDYLDSFRNGNSGTQRRKLFKEFVNEYISKFGRIPKGLREVFDNKAKDFS